MAALTKARSTRKKHGGTNSRRVKASAQIWAGALVCLDANGFLVPGSTSTTLKADGRASESVKGGATDGAVSCTVDAGVFDFVNSAAADQITLADIGTDCFIVDDQTVAKTNGGNTRSVAGRVVDVEGTVVWVAVGTIRS